MIIKSFVKTLTGSTAVPLATDAVKSVHLGAKIYADNGDTVYIGGADVSADTGFLLPTTPGDALSLGDIGMEGEGLIDLTKSYVIGANGDKVRVVYLKDAVMV
jgi:hypothetical protein